jgi:hypothetical protein
MHQYLYYLHYYSYYDRKDGKFNKCPMKRLLEALISNDIYDLGPYADKEKNPNWTGTYDSYNVSNSIRSKQQALNAHPKVVYNVFKSLTIINPLAACSEISTDWVKHLVKIYKPTYLYLDKGNVKHLTDGVEITFEEPTPLETALVNNKLDDIYNLISSEALLSSEAFFFNIRNVRDPLLLDLLFDKYAVVGGINNTYKSYTALHLATLYNNRPLISKLVSLEGIVISKQSAKGETCLHMAAKMASGKFYQDPLTDKPIAVTPDATDSAFDIVKLLLDKYPALADISDNSGKTPGNKEYVIQAIQDYIKSKKTTLLSRVWLGQNKEKTARLRGGKKGKRRGTKRRRQHLL